MNKVALKIKQTLNFSKQFKKLKKTQKKNVGSAIDLIAKDPSIGNAKIGDLSGIFVYKFNIDRQNTLLAYQFNDIELVLLALGTHQNFYRDLKNKIKTL